MVDAPIFAGRFPPEAMILKSLLISDLSFSWMCDSLTKGTLLDGEESALYIETCSKQKQCLAL
jgi:hypothetical protein